MATDYNAELRRPVSLALAAFALIGWLLFFWNLASSGSQRAQDQARLTTLQQQSTQLDEELTKERAAAGALTDIEAKQTAAEAAAAEADKTVADATKAREDAEAGAAQARDALAQATTAREAAEKAAAEANTEHDRVAAETATIQQGNDALKQQTAEFEQPACRPQERAGGRRKGPRGSAGHPRRLDGRT